MNNPIDEYIYILGDGDRTREKIEYHLLNKKLELLTNLSQNLIEAINEIKVFATSTMHAEVIMAGGDDILLRIDLKKYRREHIEKLNEIFYQSVGSTISFGVGRSVEAAYINLRKAKASKSNKIIEEGVNQ